MAKGKYQEWLKPDGLLRIEGWARDGLSEKQIAEEKMGVSYSTFRDWKDKYPALLAPLKGGKEVPDRKVENALYDRAIGCKVTEETINYGPDDEVLSRKVVVKEIPPDIGAITMWLGNRKPENWRDKKQIELSGEVNNPFAGLTTDELKKLVHDG